MPLHHQNVKQKPHGAVTLEAGQAPASAPKARQLMHTGSNFEYDVGRDHLRKDAGGRHKTCEPGREP